MSDEPNDHGRMGRGTKLAIAGVGMGVLYLVMRERDANAATPPQQPSGNVLEARSQSPAPAPALPDYGAAPPQPTTQTTYIERQFEDQPRGDLGIWTMQRQLRDLGYDPAGLDGRWGSRTQTAAQDFARSFGITPPTRFTTSFASFVSRAWSERYAPSNVPPAFKPQGSDSGSSKPLAGFESDNYRPSDAIAGLGAYDRLY